LAHGDYPRSGSDWKNPSIPQLAKAYGDAKTPVAADNMSHKDSSNQSRTETITPLSVHIKNRGSDPEGLQKRHRYGFIILICAAIILVALGGWFLHYLSENPIQPNSTSAGPSATPPKPSPETTAPVAITPQPAEDPEKLAIDKQVAEQKLADYLEIKKELDDQGAAEWGG